MINPILLTLSGDSRMGWIEALIANAVTNVTTDVIATRGGTQDMKTTVLNFLLPNIGKMIGSRIWKPEATTAQAAPLPPIPEIVNKQNNEKAAVISFASLIPLSLTIANQVSKGAVL